MSTNADRQAAYRKRRAEAGENGERRLNTWVTTGASLALARLARHHGISQRAMLERLIVQADDAILQQIELESEEWGRYFGGVTA